MAARYLRYRHVATIRAAFEFPIDMLRYDACQPYREEDSHAIARSVRGESADQPYIEVRVVRENNSDQHGFSRQRWESFGANVVGVVSEPWGNH